MKQEFIIVKIQDSVIHNINHQHLTPLKNPKQLTYKTWSREPDMVQILNWGGVKLVLSVHNSTPFAFQDYMLQNKNHSIKKLHRVIN